jgi:GAF domain-containing protein
VTLSERAVVRSADVSTWGVLERLGRTLYLREPTLQATLDAVVLAAVETVEHADFASINLVFRGRFLPQAAAGEPPNVLDAFQRRTGCGPCAEASARQTVVLVEDMLSEARWDGFAEVAIGAGVLSMLCVPLSVEDRELGSLTLHATHARAFDDHDCSLAKLFATFAAIALSDAQRTENLRAALNNRDVIGQAKGILIERHRVTAERAFELLSDASQRSNRKLAEVAELFVQTGELS